MDEIAITTTPVDLGDALGGLEGNFRLQNRGPVTVYRSVAAAAPVPADVRGWRHPVGDTLLVTLLTVDPTIPRTWLWTAEGTATVVVEPEPWT